MPMFLGTNKNSDLGTKYRYTTSSFFRSGSTGKPKTKYYQKDRPIFHLADPVENAPIPSLDDSTE